MTVIQKPDFRVAAAANTPTSFLLGRSESGKTENGSDDSETSRDLAHAPIERPTSRSHKESLSSSGSGSRFSYGVNWEVKQ